MAEGEDKKNDLQNEKLDPLRKNTNMRNNLNVHGKKNKNPRYSKGFPKDMNRYQSNQEDFKSKLCYEETITTRKYFYPDKGSFDPKIILPQENNFNKNSFKWPREEQKQAQENNFNKNSFKQPREEQNQGKQNSRKPELNQIIIENRQNHERFIFETANKTRSCTGCWKAIYPKSIIIKHREREIGQHPKFGWKEPMYSDLRTQFYHLNENCLKLAGYKKDYLNLCYIEINTTLDDNVRKTIQKCGFLRPIIDKQSADIIKTKSSNTTSVIIDVEGKLTTENEISRNFKDISISQSPKCDNLLEDIKNIEIKNSEMETNLNSSIKQDDDSSEKSFVICD